MYTNFPNICCSCEVHWIQMVALNQLNGFTHQQVQISANQCYVRARSCVLEFGDFVYICWAKLFVDKWPRLRIGHFQHPDEADMLSHMFCIWCSCTRLFSLTLLYCHLRVLHKPCSIRRCRSEMFDHREHVDDIFLTKRRPVSRLEHILPQLYLNTEKRNSCTW